MSKIMKTDSVTPILAMSVLFDHFRETDTRRPAMPRCWSWCALPLHRPGVMEWRAPLALDTIQQPHRRPGVNTV